MENKVSHTNGVRINVAENGFEQQTSKPLPNLDEDLPVPVTAQPVPVAIELTNYMKKSLAIVAQNEGFRNYTLQEEKGSNVGDGFIGILFKVHISEVKVDKKLTVILKAPPLNMTRRVEFGALKLFKREVLMYNKVLPSFVDFQNEKGISKSQGFFNFPKCYFAEYDEDLQDSVIIMEDLNESGCKMWDKFVTTNYEHARMVMESLGKFHAVSFAMKSQRPDIFEQYKLMEDVMTNRSENESFETYMLSCVDRAMTTIADHETVKINKMQRFRANFLSIMKELVKPDNAEPYAVIGHGDCWSNNFMFQYRRNRPERIVLLDWQISRYCSPVLDLMYFIFCCTDSAMRSKHYDELLGIYHKSLKDLLEQLGGDIMSQFPFTAFLRQLKNFGKFGITMSMFLIPMLTMKNEDLPDMDKMAENFKDMSEEEMMNLMKGNDEVYNLRMGGVIKDAVKFGYI